MVQYYYDQNCDSLYLFFVCNFRLEINKIINFIRHLLKATPRINYMSKIVKFMAIETVLDEIMADAILQMHLF